MMPWAPASSPVATSLKWLPTLAPPTIGSGGGYWTGSTFLDIELLGWWDGTTIQPASIVGWWDGTEIQPLA